MTLTLKREFFSVFLCYKVIFWLNEMLYHTLLSFQKLNIICLLLRSSDEWEYTIRNVQNVSFFQNCKNFKFCQSWRSISSILFQLCFPTKIHLLVLPNFKELWICKFSIFEMPTLRFLVVIKIVKNLFYPFLGNRGIFWFYMVSRKH